MALDTVTQKLKSILVAELRSDLTAEQIADEEPLMADGLDLDSIGIVTLIEVVETSFDFQFEDADLRTATFDSVSTLAQAISKRIDS